MKDIYQKKEYKVLTIEELVREKKHKYPIYISLLNDPVYESGYVLPAILDIDEKTGELVALYTVDSELRIRDYKKTWVAYHYNAEMVANQMPRMEYEKMRRNMIFPSK